ncbi:MAG: alpha/beta hydrolase [Rhodospirillaceae bacterium]|jgi:pimeloyl-ACP methyl ester carboxylesterase|nr:alpha/beta hydrolase [Rhodospirillaceae bacterium]MBT5193623.1 alpha/beta hydrolase [Rhodospirillaceae bacterium]MBT5895456.1 alpha/beta hydrolase [Rhodospirillaceae bacterium]MBT6427185.1 alpha/beta hydrolase [Rhodospirillaceae bacterium]MBT7759871.1 alpha/beta hydrolase [Rhodospirillaceae bacterium]
MEVNFIDAGILNVAYQEWGPPAGRAVILLHGFPYDIHAYDEVAPCLAAAGCRVIVPYLRGYGPTRFLSAATPRSGEQAALGDDLRALMDALGMERAVLGGYDWGGRAACVVAALWPERVAGLVSCNGYNIQNIAGSNRPAPPEMEHKFWYQYYFHSERGRAGLEANRHPYCKLLWRLWSPNWTFDDATYDRTAASFENPDFVAVVIHSYRHRYALVAGDPAVAEIEARLAERPLITVPTIAMDGAGDGVMSSQGCAGHERFFSGAYRRDVIPSVGHNLPQEAPEAFADAVLSMAE